MMLTNFKAMCCRIFVYILENKKKFKNINGSAEFDRNYIWRSSGFDLIGDLKMSHSYS